MLGAPLDRLDVDLELSGLVALIREPAAVGREGRELLGEVGAIEERALRLRLEGREPEVAVGARIDLPVGDRAVGGDVGERGVEFVDQERLTIPTAVRGDEELVERRRVEIEQQVLTVGRPPAVELGLGAVRQPRHRAPLQIDDP